MEILLVIAIVVVFLFFVPSLSVLREFIERTKKKKPVNRKSAVAEKERAEHKEIDTRQERTQQTKRITLDIVKQVYPLAKSVREGKLDITDVQNKLAKDMDPGSAQDYVRAFLHMMEGECYKRTINAAATEYYLEMIHADFGQQALRIALSAVKQHTKYYGDLGYGRLVSIESIHREFSKKLPEA